MKRNTTKARAESRNSLSPLAAKLSEHIFLRNLDPEHLETLARCGDALEKSAGEYLWRQGEQPEVVYLISSGEVALEINVPHQGALEVDLIREGEFLPWLWLSGPYRRHFDARARRPVKGFVFDGKLLRGECEQDHDFGYLLLKRFARATEERLQATRLKVLELQGFEL